MAADAQIVKCAFGPLFVTVFVSRILSVAVCPVTSYALHEYRHTAELRSLMMTADALGTLLPLMRELAIRIQVRFVMPMPEKDYAAGSFEVELDNARGRITRLYPVAIALLTSRKRPCQQADRHSDNKESQHCKLESHLFTGLP